MLGLDYGLGEGGGGDGGVGQGALRTQPLLWRVLHQPARQVPPARPQRGTLKVPPARPHRGTLKVPPARPHRGTLKVPPARPRRGSLASCTAGMPAVTGAGALPLPRAALSRSFRGGAWTALIT